MPRRFLFVKYFKLSTAKSLNQCGRYFVITNQSMHPSAILHYFSEKYFIFTFPLSIFRFLFNIVVTLCSIARFLVWVTYTIVKNLPFLTTIVIWSIDFLILYRISRISPIIGFLCVIVPYSASIVHTIFVLLFPHVYVVSQIFRTVLCPIRWLHAIEQLLCGQIYRLPERIRQVLEVLTPIDDRLHLQDGPVRQTSDSSTLLTEELLLSLEARIQCCICTFREKSILLRPCNHLCLCETCFLAVWNKQPPTCPICRRVIASHICVFL